MYRERIVVVTNRVFNGNISFEVPRAYVCCFRCVDLRLAQKLLNVILLANFFCILGQDIYKKFIEGNLKIKTLFAKLISKRLRVFVVLIFK